MDIVGKIFNSKKFGEFVVISKTNDRIGTNILYIIEFSKTKYRAKVKKDRILKGSIKDIYYPIKYNVACIGNASSYHLNLYFYGKFCNKFQKTFLPNYMSIALFPHFSKAVAPVLR